MRMRVWLATVLAVILYSNVGAAQSDTPAIASAGFLNAASLAADTNNIAAPGSLISIFGKNLGTGTAIANNAPLPFNLGGTVVQMGNVFAPLLFVSSTQINAQIPFEIQAGTSVNVVVWVNGTASAPASLKVSKTAPGIFTTLQNGVGPGSIMHDADSTPVNTKSPALPGEVVQIFCTGLGTTVSSATMPPLLSGQAGAGQPTLAVPTVTIGGSSATVTSATATSMGVGIYMIKAILPNVPAGDQAVAITTAGNTTKAAVTIAVALPPTPSGGGSGGGSGSGSGGSGSGSGGSGSGPDPNAPVIFKGGILNGATFDSASADTAAPGGLISIFGNKLATTTVGGGNAPLQVSLGGTSVLINNISAPLLLVSPTQINAQVPFEIQPGSTVNVVVTANGLSSAAESLNVVPAAPGIFTVAGNGAGPADVFHADGTIVSSTSPALPGEVLTVMVTGLGTTISTANLPAAVTGQAGNGQLTVLMPTVTFGDLSKGVTAHVISSVATPGMVGEYTVKFSMPELTAGDQIITVSAAGSTSRAAGTVRVGFPFALPAAFSQMRVAGPYASNFGFQTTVTVQVLVPGDPTANPPTKDTIQIKNGLKATADFSRSLPCTIDLAGGTGPLYTAVVECKDISNPANFSAIKLWLKDGNFFNNEIIFPTLSSDPAAESFFFLNASAPIPVPADAGPTYIPGTEVPSVLFVTEAAPITTAVMSIDFNSLAQGASVVGTINLQVGDTPKTIIGGTFTGTITSVQQ